MTPSQWLNTIAPQFDATANRTNFIALAETQINRCWFVGKEDYAVALMAAHLLSVFTSTYRKDGTGGSVTSKREGDLSISFASFSSGDSDLNQSSYGLQLQRLMKAGGFILGVTGGCDYVC